MTKEHCTMSTERLQSIVKAIENRWHIHEGNYLRYGDFAAENSLWFFLLRQKLVTNEDDLQDFSDALVLVQLRREVIGLGKATQEVITRMREKGIEV